MHNAGLSRIEQPARRRTAPNKTFGNLEGEGASTMRSPFDDLWVTTGSDGATAYSEPLSRINAQETDLLMRAWQKEREDRIESEILLEEALALLSRVVATKAIPCTVRRKGKRLLNGIQAVIAVKRARGS
jgi:hypothetical protein